jgi:hypothetical protein
MREQLILRNLDGILAVAVAATYFYNRHYRYLHPTIAVGRIASDSTALQLLGITFPYVVFWALISGRVAASFAAFTALTVALITTSGWMMLVASGHFVGATPPMSMLLVFSLAQTLIFIAVLNACCRKY